MNTTQGDVLKLLSLGYCFPPVASAESYVTARILGNIPNSTIDHISADASLISGRIDPSLDEYIDKRFNAIHRVKASKFVRFMNNKFTSMPFRPDRWVLLNKSCYLKAIELNPLNFDALITRSQYHSIHLVGYKLKQKFPNLPWVACFSDPWSGADHSRNVPIFSRWSKYMENIVLRSADTLIFPTEGLAEFYARQNPNANVLAKTNIIPHTIDSSLLPKTPPQKKDHDQIIGRCLGSFYGPRRVAPLLKGIRALLESSDKYKNKLQIELIGANEEVKHQISLYNLEKYIQVKPSVNWSEAIALMKQSDFLILVEAPSHSPSFYMPSKLIDYLSAQKPIFALSPNGTSSDIVSSAGGIIVSPNQNADEIAQGLHTTISEGKHSNIMKNFDAVLHGDRLSDILQSLTYKNK
jgi:glycosyltransferase involved in cell wall biosynthesis